ncbi:zinc metalloprotease [Alsobacter metallidurans]|uniref:Zinc metalloprotease n=1 Tax=Alsobacter metallidurans TaxID=340221 RepID=A0A917MI72_9HYPH|nr:RIP metalloprotease RseP [Alsobacter metallidurans]GGH21852.1 zinc metalloprotease [Alsobacter metallidurans]
MTIFETLAGWAGSAGGYILPFLFVLVIVIFIHEFGHYIVGRWCGIRVQAFALGFGPELFGFTDSHGTRWKVCAVPLGGYVKFFGDSGAASTPDGSALRVMSPEERAVSFHFQPVWKRAAVVAAGPIANFILAIAVFSAMNLTYGRQVLAPRIEQVVESSAAAKAGLQSNDMVLAIEGRPVDSFADMQRIISTSPGVPLRITLERAGKEITVTATPELKVINTPFGKQRLGMLGLQGSRDPADLKQQTLGVGASLKGAVEETWFIVERTGAYVGGLFAGTESTDQLSGPIRIAQISGQVATNGIVALLNLAAILSVSIGLINLVPVPLLDGGHLLFYAFEAIRGRPLSERTQEYGFRVGLALVVMLMLFTTFNDVVHLVSL